MDITIYQTMLPHDDPDASLVFYRDTLGSRYATTSNTAGCTGSRPPRPARHVHRPVPGGRLSRRHRRRAPHHRRDDGQGTYASINLATTDLDGTFGRLQAGDAEVVQEPTDQPYGVRDCAFRDPAGNLIRIQELR